MPLSLFYKEKSGAFSFGFPRLPPPSSCQVPMPDSQRIRYLLSITQVLSLQIFLCCTQPLDYRHYHIRQSGEIYMKPRAALDSRSTYCRAWRPISPSDEPLFHPAKNPPLLYFFVEKTPLQRKKEDRRHNAYGPFLCSHTIFKRSATTSPMQCSFHF